jgi:hypothetical protein
MREALDFKIDEISFGNHNNRMYLRRKGVKLIRILN